MTKRDSTVLSVLDDLKEKGEWPRRRDRLKQFIDVKDLNAL